MTRVGSTTLAERPEMVGAYLRASAVTRISRVLAAEVTDRIIALEDIWGPQGCAVAAILGDINEEAARLSHLESVLLRFIAHSRTPTTSPNVPGLAALICKHRGRLTVQCLAEAAGTSRQHLTRVFREIVGLSPKMYCRLARFHATLRYGFRGRNLPWAQIAADMCYADQSHLIAEFRHFSSLTPNMLADGRWFHPFIERECYHHQKLEPATLPNTKSVICKPSAQNEILPW